LLQEFQGLGHVQVIEFLPSKYKVLSSNSSTRAQKKKKKEKKKKTAMHREIRPILSCLCILNKSHISPSKHSHKVRKVMVYFRITVIKPQNRENSGRTVAVGSLLPTIRCR
jgi:hypothetical protein